MNKIKNGRDFPTVLYLSVKRFFLFVYYLYVKIK